jgi:GT2 family glycosyltransferase
VAEVSVVVPTYERPGLLERLLSSVFASGVDGELEVVVVDDGSHAGTYDLAAARFPQVVWLQQERAGPAAARNRGWRKSSSSVVVFVDDDCVLEADALHALCEALEQNDAVGATIEPLHRGQLVADFMHAEHLVTHKVEDGRVRWLVTACLAVRRPVLERLGGFDEKLTSAGGEDVDLSLRLREADCRLAVSEKAIVFHDHRAGLVQLARTYYRHGTGQRRLAQRHPERRSDLAGSAHSRLSPKAWIETYRGYRVNEGALTSATFVLLRFVMMVPWLTGAFVGPARSRRR